MAVHDGGETVGVGGFFILFKHLQGGAQAKPVLGVELVEEAEAAEDLEGVVVFSALVEIESHRVEAVHLLVVEAENVADGAFAFAHLFEERTQELGVAFDFGIMLFGDFIDDVRDVFRGGVCKLLVFVVSSHFVIPLNLNISVDSFFVFSEPVGMFEGSKLFQSVLSDSVRILLLCAVHQILYALLPVGLVVREDFLQIFG